MWEEGDRGSGLGRGGERGGWGKVKGRRMEMRCWKWGLGKGGEGGG